MLRRLVPYALGAVLLVLTAIIALLGHQLDRDDDQRARDTAAQQVATTLDALGRDLGGRATDLAGLFESSEQISSELFPSFTARILSSGAASAFTWQVVVDGSERATFERSRGFTIKEIGPDGKLRRSARRDQYAVIVETAIRRGAGRSVTGLDTSVEPVRGAAMDRAARLRRPQLTGVVELAASGQPGFVLYAPAFSDPRPDGSAGGELLGFVSAIYRIDDLRDALAPAFPAGFAVRISADGKPVWSRGQLNGPLGTKIVDLGGKRVTIQTASAGPGRGGLNRANGAIAVGLLFALAAMLIARQAVMAAENADVERDRAVNEREWQERATRELLAHLPDLAVLHFDGQGRLTGATGGLLDRLDWQGEGVANEDLASRFPADTAELRPCIDAALRGEECATEVPAAGGEHYWVQALPVSGAEPRGTLMVTNITPLMEAHQAQARAEERFERAFEDAPVGMALLTDDDRITQVNAALCALFGRSPEELIGKRSRELTHPDDTDISAGALELLLSGKQRAVQFEKRYLRGDGAAVWAAVHMTILTERDGSTMRLAQVVDMSERRRFVEQLEHLADHDPLTGIPNRRAFERAVDAHAVGTHGHGGGAVMMVDLDHFKEVNDQLGHQAGDELLIGIAETLRETLREGDTVARLGGDEFAVLLTRATPAEAEIVAAKLVAEVRLRGAAVGTVGPTPTATVGVASFGGPITSGLDAMRAADRAMYAAKAASRDAYAVYDPAVHGSVGEVQKI